MEMDCIVLILNSGIAPSGSNISGFTGLCIDQKVMCQLLHKKHSKIYNFYLVCRRTCTSFSFAFSYSIRGACTRTCMKKPRKTIQSQIFLFYSFMCFVILALEITMITGTCMALLLMRKVQCIYHIYLYVHVYFAREGVSRYILDIHLSSLLWLPVYFPDSLKKLILH